MDLQAPQQPLPQQQQEDAAVAAATAMDADTLQQILARTNVKMLLSHDERRRALTIKAAVLADDELEPLSDMMYAQYAIVDGDNLEASLDRIRHLQLFREEYNIRGASGNLEHASSISKAFLQQHPGHMLSIGYNAMDGNYVVIFDQARCELNALKYNEQWEIFLVYGWYLYQAICPDFHAIRYVTTCLLWWNLFLCGFLYAQLYFDLSIYRQGTVIIAECEGMDWKTIDIKSVRRVWEELLVPFPIDFRELKFFHTGLFANLTVGLMKQFLPERIHSRFNLGCQFEQRLDTFYRVPNDDVADQRIQSELECYLKLRYENERAFRL